MFANCTHDSGVFKPCVGKHQKNKRTPEKHSVPHVNVYVAVVNLTPMSVINITHHRTLRGPRSKALQPTRAINSKLLANKENYPTLYTEINIDTLRKHDIIQKKVPTYSTVFICSTLMSRGWSADLDAEKIRTVAKRKNKFHEMNGR